MKRKLLLIQILSLSIIFGCKKDHGSQVLTSTTVLSVDIGPIANHLVSEEQANKIAIIQSVYPSTIQRGFSVNGKSTAITSRKMNKTIKSNFTVNPDKSDAAFYIINYEEGGFAIVSGDDRVEPILAYSDNNKFPIDENSTYPAGLVTWLKTQYERVQKVRKKNEKQSILMKTVWSEVQMKSQLVKTNSIVTPGPFPSCTVNGRVYAQVSSVDPLLGTYWGQGVGYNDLIPMPSHSCTSPGNGRPPVGCVATATAQIMYYYRYPSTINWNAMDLLPNGNIYQATLMRDLGTYLHMDYSCDGSGAYNQDIPNVLKNNYSYATADYSHYFQSIVLNNLRQGYPVILGGAHQTGIVSWWFFGSYKGHTWVVDGYINTNYYVCDMSIVMDPVQNGINDRGQVVNVHITPIDSPGTPSPPRVGSWMPTYGTTYYHMNWGWDGAYNDWYSAYDWTPSGSSYGYNNDTDMVTNIHP